MPPKKPQDQENTPAGKKAAGKGKAKSSTAEDARLAALEHLERLTGARKKKPSLSPDQRREILNELFYEGDARLPYIRQYYTLLSLSAGIASFGLVLNSTAVVIGAMLLSPLMTPILGIAAALIMGWPLRVIRVFGRLVISTLLVGAIAYAFLWLFQIPTEIPLPDEVLTRTNPNAFDLLVALCAGIAGAYMLVRKEALSALPGVAIAVALVPPLCTAGLLTYLEDYELAEEAFFLYATNMACIVLAAAAVLLIMGFKPRVSDLRFHLRVGTGFTVSFAVFLMVAVPLGLRTFQDIRDAYDRVLALRVTEEWIGRNPAEITELEVEDNVFKIQLRLDLPFEALQREKPPISAGYFSPDMTLESLRERLEARLKRPVDVSVRGDFGFWLSTCPERMECLF